MNSKLSYAIAVILGGSSVGVAYAAPAPDAESSADTITEITVTAQRRTEFHELASVDRAGGGYPSTGGRPEIQL